MKNLVITLFVTLPLFTTAQKVPCIKDGLLNAEDSISLGLGRLKGMETFTVFSPKDSNECCFNSGAVITALKDTLYCMWQSSRKDEDALDTWVAYSKSGDNGKTWSKVLSLTVPQDSGYYTSGGWMVYNDTLTAFVNKWTNDLKDGGQTYYTTSKDGQNWSRLQIVTKNDGTPLQGVLEQDPHVISGGRIINACHFQPGLHVCPVYTDDTTGHSGWQKGQFTYTDRGQQSRELEPSSFIKSNGDIVMLFRDQSSSYHKLASISSDRGKTWSEVTMTNIPDARTKQSAGNLPDGRPFMICCPVTNKQRIPLVIMISNDGGDTFDEAWLLRGRDEITPPRFAGKAKRMGYHYPKSFIDSDFLYVSYSDNKEDIKVTRIPLSAL